jgi:ribonuclease VapC
LSVVHDASSLLAVTFREPGAENARESLRDSLTSSVNWSEVLQKILEKGGDIQTVMDVFTGLGVRIVPFSASHAEVAARLHEVTSRGGLSLGDRACLALGIETGLEVVTADRSWATLDLEVTVRLIR